MFVAEFLVQAAAQNIDITGTVIDSATGKGIEAATVRIASAGISTTTGSNGTFALSKNAVIKTGPGNKMTGSFYITGLSIRFFVAVPSAIKIEVYSMGGRLVSKVVDRILGAGAYSLHLGRKLQTGTYVVFIRSNGWSSLCRMSVCGSSAVGTGPRILPGAALGPYAKEAAVADTLIAFKAGFTTFRKFISSYTLSNQQCVIAPLGCTNPSFTTSDPNGGWSTGGYYVHNNMWNVSGYQVAETLNACSYRNWYVVANMNDNSGDGAVKTYPNVHKDYDNAPISSFNSLTSTFAGAAPRVGIYDVAYDIWTNGVATNGSTEFMIWTENYNQKPSGGRAATASFGGRAYAVWKTSNNKYIAFLPADTLTSGTIDILDIFKWTMNQGWLPATSTLGQICYGIEFVSTNSANAVFRCTDFSISSD